MSLKTWLASFILLAAVAAKAQTVSLVGNLATSINETSGLVFLNQKLITHNDSGGEPALYEIDTLMGQVLRTVYIKNASNIDWEDIAVDQSYIYIGDFGNNLGNRTDLKIYRVAISDYLTTNSDTVVADTINFSYSNQSDFTPANMATNFDAEALISTGDSLYIFTKNWKNSWTNIYSLPNMPGTYSIDKKDSLDVKGYITGATLDASSQNITLIGYTFLLPPFVVQLSGFNNGSFSNITLQKTTLPFKSSYSTQTEGICYLRNDKFFITAEELQGKSAALFTLDMNDNLSNSNFQQTEILLYPNPTSKILTLNNPQITQSEIYTESGRLLLKSNQQEIDVSKLDSGTYILITLDSNGKADTTKVVIK